MLVLSRQVGQTIMIGDDIFVTVDEVFSDAARIRVCASAGIIEPLTDNVLEKRTNTATMLLHRDMLIRLGPDVTLTVVGLRGDKVRVGIQNPPDMPVHRKEVYEVLKRERYRRDYDI
jgi:carbon storage regulator